jgi:hypothetical protein
MSVRVHGPDVVKCCVGSVREGSISWGSLLEVGWVCVLRIGGGNKLWVVEECIVMDEDGDVLRVLVFGEDCSKHLEPIL